MKAALKTEDGRFEVIGPFADFTLLRVPVAGIRGSELRRAENPEPELAWLPALATFPSSMADTL